MLIGVVGLNGSGKDTFAKYLVDELGFAHKDLGQEIRDELKVLGRNHLDRNEMIVLGNERRQKFGYNYWCKRAIESLPPKNIIITSIRNPVEVDEIKSRGGVIVEVFADQRVRFDRTVVRVKSNLGLHGDAGSFEEFKEKEARELSNPDPSKQQLLKCISLADYRLDNNGSVAKLGKEISALFLRLGN
jgi:dephospho-CoA kinase